MESLLLPILAEWDFSNRLFYSMWLSPIHRFVSCHAKHKSQLFYHEQ